jgi:hypothetical protein
MGSYILDAGATVMCSHGGTATPTNRSTRVRAGGQAVITQSSTCAIAGCSNVYGTVYVPCVTAQFTSAATRVRAGGEPVLLQSSQATTTPNGVSLTIASTQTRVQAT